MKLKLKKFEIFAGRPIAFMSEDTSIKLNVHIGDRIEASYKGKKAISRVDIINGFLSNSEIVLSEEALAYLKAKPGTRLEVNFISKAKSSAFIAKKMNGKSLSGAEIHSIIKDVVNNALTEVETAQFIVAVYKNGMSFKETVDLTEAMYKTGSIISWHTKEIIDKHCIGGIPGNRTTPIVVSICSALGLIMPKTSSRAITSAAGTADVVETLCRVDFPEDKLKGIVKKTNACLAWGGSLGLAPADDKLIKVERILNLDPESQLLASILSKKISVGSKYVLIDIPFGEEAKVNRSEAEALKKKFIRLGKHFKLKMKVVLTLGNQPIGNGIGPVLEMLDVLKVLRRKDYPKDLEKKSVFLASQILEMVGKCPPGKGEELALKVLNSGAAYNKLIEIVNAQGRNTDGLKLAKFSHIIKSKKNGKIRHIKNKKINFLASLLGCPVDKGAGIYLYKHIGDSVKKGELLLKLYSESREKLKEVLESFNRSPPISLY